MNVPEPDLPLLDLIEGDVINVIYSVLWILMSLYLVSGLVRVSLVVRLALVPVY